MRTLAIRRRGLIRSDWRNAHRIRPRLHKIPTVNGETLAGALQRILAGRRTTALQREDSMVTLSPGVRIDRFGRPTGGFVALEGTPFGERALPVSSYDSEYHVYEVMKPIEGVRAGPAEPWFDQPGRGIQFQLPRSVAAHLKDGELSEIADAVKPDR